MEELVESFALKNIESSEKLHNETLQNNILREKIKFLEKNVKSKTTEMDELKTQLSKKEKNLESEVKKFNDEKSKFEISEKEKEDIIKNLRKQVTTEQQKRQRQATDLENQLQESKLKHKDEADRWNMIINRYKENEQVYPSEFKSERRSTGLTVRIQIPNSASSIPSIHNVSLISFQAFRNLPSKAGSMFSGSMPLRSHHCSRYCSIAARLADFVSAELLVAASGLPLLSPSTLTSGCFGSGVGESPLFGTGVGDLSFASRWPFCHSWCRAAGHFAAS